jgi:hypothetical protein
MAATTTSAQRDLKWEVLNTGTTKDINDIYFHSPDTGYIVGENYLFKKTTDGGKSWVDLPPPLIGEWPTNFGNIAGIDYYMPGQFSTTDTGLFLVWEQGYHGVITNNDGANYSYFGFTDSAAFCKANGFSVLPASNGYVSLLTYGQNCNGIATYANHYDGGFSFSFIDSAFANEQGSFTDVDVDSSAYILAHSNGNLLRYQFPTAAPTATLLDTTGVSAVGYAGHNTWYASTNRGIEHMYISTDGGLNFSLDTSFPQTFYYPNLHDFSFMSDGTLLTGGTSNGAFGVIIYRDTFGWFFQSADYPIRAVRIFDDGSAYAAGDSGLVMKLGPMLTGISEVQTGTPNPLHIYPNPAKEQFTIQYTSEITQLRLFNLRGETVSNMAHPGLNPTIDVGHLAPGVYVVEVESESVTIHQRVVLY